jgi:hypothetical protein
MTKKKQSSKFAQTLLAGERVLVQGPSGEQCILDADQFNELKRQKAFDAAAEEFDQVVNEFFAPMLDAISLIQDKLGATEIRTDDPYVLVLEPAVEGAEGRPAKTVYLDHDTAVLRLLEAGQEDRLVWIGSDRIEILA